MAKAKTVLLVDSDSNYRTALGKRLADASFQVVMAANGVEGIAQARALLPDLIISEVLLPEKNGLQFCSELKSLPFCRDIPFIFLTGCCLEDQEVIAGIQRGAAAYLFKDDVQPRTFSRVDPLLEWAAELTGSKKKEQDRWMVSIPALILFLHLDAGFEGISLRTLLESSGYKVIDAYTPAEAAMKLADYQFDLVLISYRQPLEELGNALELISNAGIEGSRVVVVSHQPGQLAGAPEFPQVLCFYAPVNYFNLLNIMEILIELNRQQSRHKSAVKNLKAYHALMTAAMSSLREWVLDQFEAGVAVLDMDGNVIWHNRIFVKLAGLDTTAVGMLINQLFLQNDSELIVQLKDIVEKTRRERQTSLELICYQDGSERNLKISGNLLSGLDDQPVGLILVLRDDSARQALESLASRSQRLSFIGEVAAGAAHEIRNPLTSIKGFAQLLAKELAGNPKGKYLDIILEELERINKLLKTLMNLAKPHPPQVGKTSSAQLISELEELLRGETLLRDISLTIDCEGNLPDLSADCEQIKQVLINALLNALEATQAGGSIVVGAKKNNEPDWLTLYVKDTGRGIPAHLLPQVFDPFFTTKLEGTGLGLFLCRQIVENHGGRISIESQEGQGTTLFVHLPVNSLGAC
ncbi:MAG: response regulator [Syntrophomonadaceae bacterium]|nr:response regulator [Syntrophomonadaceae bacterium]